jgi:acyl-CoA synthetase (AMP-forming)/AMP-acid ligase II
VVDDRGTTVPPGEKGEIVIRGPNVMAEYENNPKANADAFVEGWFRTGDQGTMDAEGYLAITGRLKEIINRGGEKISPREVDEIIMEHPAVHQCVTFGVPHDMLGEEVAAAVVLKEGAMADDKELRAFAAVRLADFKVPKKILILKEIPVGATGKLQRIGLAQKLGLA